MTGSLTPGDPGGKTGNDAKDLNDPIVRALTDDPLPGGDYWPGGFAQRLQAGQLPNGLRVPTGRSGRERRGVLGLLAPIALAASIIAGLVAYRVITGPSGPGASPLAGPSPSPTATTAQPSGLGPTIKIGISLPLTGDGSADAVAVRDGVLLAIKDANRSGRLPGITIVPLSLDHSTPGGDNAEKGIADMRALARDPDVVGVVGPFQSYVANGQIPVSNTAGLLQCSPSTSSPDLTKGPPGQALRASRPDQVAFIRLSATDDEMGPSLADFAVLRLHSTRALVVDDGAAYGIGIADAFAARFQTDGAVVVRRAPTTAGASDYSEVIRAARALRPDLVMFGGVNAFNGDSSSGAGAFRRQMSADGLAGIPLIGGDGLEDLDNAGRSLFDVDGAAAANTYSGNLAPSFRGQPAFGAEFRAAYGSDPRPYAAPGYACAEIIVAAIERAAARGGISRESVRAAGTDPGSTFTTILGAIRFDAAGDITTPSISVYRADPGANGGTGAWVLVNPGASAP